MPPNSSSSAAASAFAVASSNVPAARLFSLHSAPSHAKVLHLIRHAEGTHNISSNPKTPSHHDARLTSKGVEQCKVLAERNARYLDDVDLVVCSPMTRCLQTAVLSFPHCYCTTSIDGVQDDSAGNDIALIADGGGANANRNRPSKSSNSPVVPFVAHESWRETVNFLCDSRRPLAQLQSDFPYVDFTSVQHEHDPIWAAYESKFGPHNEFDGLRESKDGAALEKRAREAWKWLWDSRPERNVAVVSHSAFFMHQFQPYLEEMEGLIVYDDEEVRELMTGRGFDNCELRSVAFEAL